VSNLYQIDTRTKCRLCNSDNLTKVVSLAPTPVAEKYLKSEELNDSQSDPLVPLDLYMCDDCSHVQLVTIVDPNFLFSDYTYYTGNSQGMVRHFEEYANYIISNFTNKKHGLVVDIGSNDGTLLKFFKRSGFVVLGIDPAEEMALTASSSGIETIPRFLSIDLANEIVNKYGTAQFVTVNNTFAHADNLREILVGAKKMLSPDGIFVFEVSYLVDILEKILLGTIFHEHLSYHSLIPLIKFLESEGLEIFHVRRVSIQGGSLIGYAQIKGSGRYKIDSSVERLTSYEKKIGINQPAIFNKFSARLDDVKCRVNKLLASLTCNGKSIAGFGAARSGTTLISYFDISKYIKYIVDDNPLKHFRYSPGDRIPVYPVSRINEDNPEYLFILAWVHSKNIIRNNIEFMSAGGSFIVCFPQFQIIDKNNYLIFIA